jgi:DNA-directed RNA polymerase subunit RPC12/RpoP
MTNYTCPHCGRELDIQLTHDGHPDDPGGWDAYEILTCRCGYRQWRDVS